MSWRTSTIKEISIGVYDGPHATPNPSDVGPIFLGIKNISEDGYLDLSEIRHISENEFSKWTKRVIPSFTDIVFSYEATLHRYAIIPEGFRGCLGRRMALIRTNKSKVDYKFLYYYFFSEQWRNEVSNYIITGATVERIPLTCFPDFKVQLPPLPTQKKIASILSAYDDLIENNLKRIKLLEEAAQNIYKEWFVNFRFPGWENAKFDEGTGWPEGWRVGCVDDLCEVKSGYAFKSKDWTSIGNPVIKIRNIDGNTVDIDNCDFVDDETAKIASKFEIFEGDVLIAMTGATVGKIGLVPKLDKSIYLNQRVGLFRTKVEGESNIGLIFSFFLSENALKQVLNLAQGAAQPNISSKQIGSISLNIANKDIHKEFRKIAQPLTENICNLYSQNQKLKEARDILLPRLMNRTINV